MLTGMLEPTTGEATFSLGEGGTLSLSRDMPAIRRRLSLCPQFDIYFEMLSVREHLEIFARFKGVSVSAARLAAIDAAREVDLLEKLDATAGSLSGGQRRRLSIAIAFIGDPKIVFLDEPTSGLDPHARRFVWELIRRRRGDGRLIVLTTHFLEEADLLSDRVAILRAGRLVAEGTPMELKHMYGTGYTLSCARADDGGATMRGEAVMACVQSCVPDARLEEGGSSDRELRIRLPKLDSNAGLISLLEELEAGKNELGVGSFGLTSTSLEDVFLKIGEPTSVAPVGAASDVDDYAIKVASEHGGPTTRRRSNSTVRRIGALLAKRLRWASRDKMPLLTQIIVPVMCVVLANIAGRAGESPPALPELPLTRQTCMMGQSAAFAVGEAVAGSWGEKVLRAYPASDWTDTGTKYTTNSINATDFDDTLPGFLLDNWYDSLTFDALLISSSKGEGSLNYTILGNETAYHAMPAALAEADSAIFRAIFGPKSLGVSVVNHPLPFSSTEKIAKINTLANNILLIVCAGLALSVLSASFAVFLVKERTCGALQLHRLSGVGHGAYWFSNLFFDSLTACVPLAAIVLVFFAFELPQFAGRGALAVVLLLSTFVTSALPLTYLLQRLYTDEIKALVSLSGVLFLLTFVSTITAMVIQTLAATDLGKTRAIYAVIKWLFRILPHYCCCMGLFDLSVNHVGLLSLVVKPYTPQIFDPLALEVTGYHIIAMAISSLVLTCCVFLVDHLPLGDWLRSVASRHQRAVIEGARASADASADASVLEEARRAEKLLHQSQWPVAPGVLHGEDNPLIVDRLCHVYGDGTVAVKSVSFAVAPSEIFGLLGVNGAGKTSTFKSIIGDISPTAGSVACDRQRTGYCPQFDATLSLLTPTEHFHLYAALRGATVPEAAALVERMLERVDLLKYRDIPSYALSGGNRRKLSVGISLIGHPRLVCLDEPSTGMSSGAKHKLWALLSAERKRRSIVLTSHSMAECEALCTRLCIMKAGVMKCLGSVQGLKAAYGSGYVAAFRTSSAAALDDLSAFIMDIVPDAFDSERAGKMAKFVLPSVGDGGTLLSAVFRAVEEEIEAGRAGCGRVNRIVSFSVSQCTLEDVFLAFAGSA